MAWTDCPSGAEPAASGGLKRCWYREACAVHQAEDGARGVSARGLLSCLPSWGPTPFPAAAGGPPSSALSWRGGQMSTLQVRLSGYGSARGKQSQSVRPRGPARLLWRHQDPAPQVSRALAAPHTCPCDVPMPAVPQKAPGVGPGCPLWEAFLL